MAARRLHNLIYATIGFCCLFLVVCSVSLGTNHWFQSSTKARPMEDGSEIKVSVSYGLFTGEKTKMSGSNSPGLKSNLKIICQGSKGCMFSCGTTAERRKQDFETLYNGAVDSDLDYMYCIEVDALYNLPQRQTNIKADGEGNKRIFINFGFYLATPAFLVFGMLFSIMSGVLALYNTYRTPIQPVLSVSGLYIWNGLSAAFVLLAMIMWVIEFTSRLRKNAAISDTLSGIHDSSGMGSLGWSFWILILAICFAVTNISILKYRTWKINKMNENNVRVTTEKLESGDILLF